jgi:hypothetical protein
MTLFGRFWGYENQEIRQSVLGRRRSNTVISFFFFCLPNNMWWTYCFWSISYSVFQLDFEIFRTIASFIKISSGHYLIIKLIFIKFFRTIWEIGEQMSWNWCLAESLYYFSFYQVLTALFLGFHNLKISQTRSLFYLPIFCYVWKTKEKKNLS